MQATTIYLTKHQHVQLGALGALTGRPMAELIRMSVDALIESHGLSVVADGQELTPHDVLARLRDLRVPRDRGGTMTGGPRSTYHCRPSDHSTPGCPIEAMTADEAAQEYAEVWLGDHPTAATWLELRVEVTPEVPEPRVFMVKAKLDWRFSSEAK